MWTRVQTVTPFITGKRGSDWKQPKYPPAGATRALCAFTPLLSPPHVPYRMLNILLPLSLLTPPTQLREELTWYDHFRKPFWHHIVKHNHTGIPQLSNSIPMSPPKGTTICIPHLWLHLYSQKLGITQKFTSSGEEKLQYITH